MSGEADRAKAIIDKIAEVANIVGDGAGEPAMELAGQFVSVLRANPEHIDRFLKDGVELVFDGTLNPENGCLTYRAINGNILSPAELRRRKGLDQ